MTGVEMEAMVAVSVAALTLYDMLKAVDRGITIDAVRLVAKSGGPERNVDGAVSYRTAVIVLSDRVWAGEREDGCIPAVREALGPGYNSNHPRAP